MKRVEIARVATAGAAKRLKEADGGGVDGVTLAADSQDLEEDQEETGEGSGGGGEANADEDLVATGAASATTGPVS